MLHDTCMPFPRRWLLSSLHRRQKSPNDALLETYSPNGVASKHIPEGCSALFSRKPHAWCHHHWRFRGGGDTWRWCHHSHQRLAFWLRGVGDASSNGAFSMVPIKLATYAFGRESNFGKESNSFSARAAATRKRKWSWRHWPEYWKCQQLWRFRVFKYTISFIIFFSCFPLQFCFRCFCFRGFGNFCVSNIFCKLFC